MRNLILSVTFGFVIGLGSPAFAQKYQHFYNAPTTQNQDNQSVQGKETRKPIKQKVPDKIQMMSGEVMLPAGQMILALQTIRDEICPTQKSDAYKEGCRKDVALALAYIATTLTEHSAWLALIERQELWSERFKKIADDVAKHAKRADEKYDEVFDNWSKRR